MDFYVWGVAERDTNRSPHNTKDSLISSIMEVFSNNPREDVIHACSRVRSCNTRAADSARASS